MSNPCPFSYNDISRQGAVQSISGIVLPLQEPSINAKASLVVVLRLQNDPPFRTLSRGLGGMKPGSIDCSKVTSVPLALLNGSTPMKLGEIPAGQHQLSKTIHS